MGVLPSRDWSRELIIGSVDMICWDGDGAGRCEENVDNLESEAKERGEREKGKMAAENPKYT